MKLTVDLGPNSYPIHIENGILAKTGELVGEVFSGKKIMIVSDDNVFPLYGEIITKALSDSGFECHSFVLPHGEPTKSFQSLPKIYEALINAKLTRSDLLIALGGGVIGDLAGFAASSYLRGIKFVQIPTSLLAQVDSSVGGKVAVDLPQGKNLVGAFYHPKAVIIDPDVLNTLPDHFISDGMGEVIKHGLIKDASYYQWLKDNRESILKRDLSICEDMVYRSNEIKKQVVENDPTEQGERALLNFGHTLGHAVEKLMNFKEFHGHCVGLGCIAASKISALRGMISEEQVQDIKNTFEAFEMPVTVSGLDWKDVYATTKSDKKMDSGVVKFILLKTVGNAYVDRTVTEEEMKTGFDLICGGNEGDRK